MSRDTSLYIEDIIRAIDSIQKFVQGQTYPEFIEDERNQFAVLKGLEIIGEAGVHLEEQIKEQYPEVEWPEIIAVRNILVHEYFNVDLEIVWDIIQNDLPRLKTQLNSTTSNTIK